MDKKRRVDPGDLKRCILRHLVTREVDKQRRSAALLEWRALIA